MESAKASDEIVKRKIENSLRATIQLYSKPQMIPRILLRILLMPSLINTTKIRAWRRDQGTVVSIDFSLVVTYSQDQSFFCEIDQYHIGEYILVKAFLSYLSQGEYYVYGISVWMEPTLVGYPSLEPIVCWGVCWWELSLVWKEAIFWISCLNLIFFISRRY